MTSDLELTVLPQFFPRHWLDSAPDIIHSEFPSRIRVGYVRRIEGGYSYLMRDALDATALTIDELHRIALRNLRAMAMPGLSVASTPGGSEAFLADSNDNFNAVRILLPVVRKALAAELGPEYFVSIPCRDWFVCWGKNQQADYQAENIREARETFLKDGHNLTPDILMGSEAGFVLYKEQPV